MSQIRLINFADVMTSSNYFNRVVKLRNSCDVTNIRFKILKQWTFPVLTDFSVSVWEL